jgi:hypothetical protein
VPPQLSRAQTGADALYQRALRPMHPRSSGSRHRGSGQPTIREGSFAYRRPRASSDSQMPHISWSNGADDSVLRCRGGRLRSANSR